MEIKANEVKKWKTIAIIAAVVAIVAVIAMFVRSGSAQPTATSANGAAVTETTEGGKAEAETAETETAETETAETGTVEAEAAGSEAAGTEEAGTEGGAKAINADEYLSYWTEDSGLRQQLVPYMEAITDEGSADYIPVEDRIAVFDFDGTLFCETDPNYFDYTLLLYRVTEDPEYKDQEDQGPE